MAKSAEKYGRGGETVSYPLGICNNKRSKIT